MHIVKQRGYGVSLAFDVGEEFSISSQKNVTLRTIQSIQSKHKHKINKHSNNHTNTIMKQQSSKQK